MKEYLQIEKLKKEEIETLKKPKLNLQNNGIFSIRANDPYDV